MADRRVYSTKVVAALSCILIPCLLRVVPFGSANDARERNNFLRETKSPKDIFATGDAYFSLTRDEVEYFVRGGTLVVLSHGELGIRTTEGTFPLSPLITIPDDATEFQVDYAGRVTITQPGMESRVTVGELECNLFSAARSLDDRYDRIAESRVAPLKTVFGEDGTFILTGWSIESK